MDNNGVVNNVNTNEEPVLIPMNDNTGVETPVIQTTDTSSFDTNIVVPSGVEVQNTNPPVVDTNTNTFTDFTIPTTVPTDGSIPVATTEPSTEVSEPAPEEKKKKGFFHKEKKVKEKKVKEKKKKEEVPASNEETISVEQNIPQKKQKSFRFPFFWIFIVALLGGYLYYTNYVYKRTVDELKYRCSPVSVSKTEVALDVNSTLVQSLYKKVATSIREDYAQPDWDNTMKLYLAYRMMPDYLKYESNCNMYNISSMKPYECEVKDFTPLAFKKEDFELYWKELFGEETELVLDNIKLRNSCIGGYQYIPEREEFVQGYCASQTAVSFKVDKKLVEAVTTRNTIILKEEVQYHGNEQMHLPDYLVSGTYYYTFRLDMNYHYVLVSKVYQDKY